MHSGLWRRRFIKRPKSMVGENTFLAALIILSKCSYTLVYASFCLDWPLDTIVYCVSNRNDGSICCERALVRRSRVLEKAHCLLDQMGSLCDPMMLLRRSSHKLCPYSESFSKFSCVRALEEQWYLLLEDSHFPRIGQPFALVSCF